MTWTLRITKKLVLTMRADLNREHAFAAERVGFAYGTTEDASTGHVIVLVRDYVPVDDDQYLNDPSVGARISGTSIRIAMQRALRDNLATFHVHMHDHEGQPDFSRVDVRETPPIVHSLSAAQPKQAHGALLLSRNMLTASVWLPGSRVAAPAGKIVIVGPQLDQMPGTHIDA